MRSIVLVSSSEGREMERKKEEGKSKGKKRLATTLLINQSIITCQSDICRITRSFRHRCRLWITSRDHRPVMHQWALEHI